MKRGTIDSADFWRYLTSKGCAFFSGVPCSILEKALFAMEETKGAVYIPAVRENSALGIASGAYLTGTWSGVLIQNSGLGNIINALTSFNLIYKIPVLIFITWRGEDGKDAPEHEVMGKKTLPILKEIGIPYKILSHEYKNNIDWAINTMKGVSIPVALIVRKGILV